MAAAHASADVHWWPSRTSGGGHRQLLAAGQVARTRRLRRDRGGMGPDPRDGAHRDARCRGPRDPRHHWSRTGTGRRTRCRVGDRHAGVDRRALPARRAAPFLLPQVPIELIVGLAIADLLRGSNRLPGGAALRSGQPSVRSVSWPSSTAEPSSSPSSSSRWSAAGIRRSGRSSTRRRPSSPPSCSRAGPPVATAARSSTAMRS